MKNIEEVNLRRPVFRVRMKNAPPPSGYFIRYVSGMDEKYDIKPGYWLSQWFLDSEGYANFNFEPEMDLHWNTENEARAVADHLKSAGGVETSVVGIGVQKIG